MDREAKIELAKELRESGLSYVKIGERVGVSHTTIQYWLKPEYAEKRRSYRRTDKSIACDSKYKRSEKGRESGRKYQQSDKGKKNRREGARKYRQTDRYIEYTQTVRQSNTHPETTYFIGSPDCNRVVIGTTTNWTQRLSNAYGKSLFPLKLLGMTRLPEKMIHKRFKHLQVPGYSCEVFYLTPELQAFIDQYCWPQIFRYSECFVGQSDTQPDVATDSA